MFSRLTSLFIAPSFSKAMAIALVFAVIINAFLCYERKVTQAENQSLHTQVALVRSDNQNLANQLENANLAIEQYRKQVNALHNKVLSKLQQAENRTNDILLELEKHKTWRDQPIPNGVGRLLNERSHSLSSGQTAPTDLPNKSKLPNAKPSTNTKPKVTNDDQARTPTSHHHPKRALFCQQPRAVTALLCQRQHLHHRRKLAELPISLRLGNHRHRFS